MGGMRVALFLKYLGPLEPETQESREPGRMWAVSYR